MGKEPASIIKQNTTLRKTSRKEVLSVADIGRKNIFDEIASTFNRIRSLFDRRGGGELRVHFAHAIDKGQREYQQDEVFVGETDAGYTLAVLADGMGGHAAGDVASKIARETFVKDLNAFLTEERSNDEIDKAAVDAVTRTNKLISQRIAKKPAYAGMGTTLVAVIIKDNKLQWISVGDSPLYLWRSKKCYQLNQDHSMAPSIDLMAQTGQITEEEALNHPDRNCLVSAINDVKPALIDHGNEPIEILENDIIVLASDGLQVVPDQKIASVIHKAREAQPLYVAAALINSAIDLDNPDQDNIALVAIKVEREPLDKKGDAAPDEEPALDREEITDEE